MTVTFESTTLATPPSGTIVGSDTIGGIDYQRVKVVWGTTGTATELTTLAPLPVQITNQSSAINVSGSFSVSSSTINIGAVQQGTSPWVTSINSSTAFLGSVAVTSGSVTATLSSGTQVIGAVNQGTSPWVTSISSSTATIGAVLGSFSLTSSTAVFGANYCAYLSTDGVSAVYVSTTNALPINASVTTSTANVGSLSISSSTNGVGVLSVSSSTNTMGAVLQGTSPWVSSISSSTAVIGSVLPSSTWLTELTSGTKNLGSVAVTSGTVTLTSGTLNLGSVAVTSGTVTLTSGALALGTVTLSSGTLNLGRVEAAESAVMMSTGVVVQPVQANVTTSSSFALIFTGATATQTNRIVSAIISVSSSTAAIFGGTFMTSAAVALSGKIFQPVSPSNTVILSFNPMGWAQTTTTAVYYQSGVLASTAVSVSVTYMPL